MNADYDFTVIGGGSAGYAAARTAAACGMKTAVIDGGTELGGLCILRGCMPSKTLIESANRALTLRRASEFGLRCEIGAPNLNAIRDRKRSLIAEFADYRAGQLQDGRFTLHRGRAMFEDPHRLRVEPMDGTGSFELSSKFFCVATGSEAKVPPIPGLAESDYWTSDDVLDAAHLPHSCIVLGGGAIALEMAHYLDAMGTEVILIQRSVQFLVGIDTEASGVVQNAYLKRGMQVFCGTKIHQVSTSEDGTQCVRFSQGDEMRTVQAERILVALGRHPATGGLGLDRAGVSMIGDKIVTSSGQQSSQTHIFTAGDVSSPLDVVHLAVTQGEIAARNAHRLLSQNTECFEEIDYRLQLFGVFSHPQVAAVGPGETALRKSGIPLRIASYPFDDHGKSMTMGETEGFVKMIAHAKTGEILSAVCVGPEATELIHEVVVAMHFRATASQFLTIPHYHPTLSEIWTYPAEEIADQIASTESEAPFN